MTPRAEIHHEYERTVADCRRDGLSQAQTDAVEARARIVRDKLLAKLASGGERAEAEEDTVGDI